MNKLYSLLAFTLLLISCQSNQQKSDCDFKPIISSGKNIDCGYLTVPENHDNPNGKKIKIAYVVLHTEATDSKEYPVIYLSGGPGGIALDSTRINRWYNHPFRAKRDIILLDQRGIGYSSPLPNLYVELNDIMAKDLTAEEEQLSVEDLMVEYARKCKEQQIDLANYNSFQNARDLGALMDHLAYEKYNLYGVSYGTRLARITQDMFPERLNSVTLNSPNPIKGDMLVDRLYSYSLALSRVFEYCENNPDCSATNPTIAADYLKAITAMVEKPLIVTNNGDSVFLNAQDGIYFIRRLLYGTDSRTEIPALIKEYLNGGGPLITDLVRTEYAPDYNFAMWFAVERHEMYNPANTEEVIDEVYTSLPLLPAQLGLFHAVYSSLGKIHTSGLEEEKKKFLPSSIPTLITVNQFDPVTPPENGHIMMETLSKGQLFILDEGGHGGGDVDCRNKVMNDFMSDPDGKLDVACLNVYKEPGM